MMKVFEDWLDWTGQGLLHLKKETLEELVKIDPNYDYNNGFPECTVNQLMYAAYNYGRMGAITHANIVREDIIDDLIAELEDMKND